MFGAGPALSRHHYMITNKWQYNLCWPPYISEFHIYMICGHQRCGSQVGSSTLLPYAHRATRYWAGSPHMFLNRSPGQENTPSRPSPVSLGPKPLGPLRILLLPPIQGFARRVSVSGGTPTSQKHWTPICHDLMSEAYTSDNNSVPSVVAHM